MGLTSPNPLVQRRRDSRCSLQSGPQWSRTADHNRSHVMSTLRLLPAVALAIAFAFPVADMALNRPAQTIASSSGAVLVTSDPSFSIHQWTVPGPGGDWGLVGFSQACYRARSTDVRLGSSSLSFGFSIYAVAGFAACAVLAAIGFAAAAFRRDHDNAA